MKAGVIFTDLDGTLLDAQTFSVGPALPVVRAAIGAGVPVVPVTSKTVAEVAPLADEIGLPGPLIIESGGGIAVRRGKSWHVEACGVAAEALRAAVPEIERRSNSRIALYADMPRKKAAEISGLSGEALQRSLQRHYDEPFIVVEGSIDRIRRVAEEIGFSVRTGGRFHHLCASLGKGDAVRRVRDELIRQSGITPVVVALGDAPMDAEFLVVADVPVIIPRPDGTPDPDLLRAVPDARIAPAPGPQGWAAAVGEILKSMLGAANAV